MGSLSHFGKYIINDSLSYFLNIYSKILEKCLRKSKGKSILDIYKCPFLKRALRLLEKPRIGCIIEN